jgi:hypothetical protein
MQRNAEQKVRMKKIANFRQDKKEKFDFHCDPKILLCCPIIHSLELDMPSDTIERRDKVWRRFIHRDEVIYEIFSLKIS